jgi:hypothetical protein
LVGLLFGVGLAPVLAMMLPDLRAEGNVFGAGSGFADVFSADLLGFFVPTQLHPLFGSLVESFDLDHSVGQHLYLGYSVLALALWGAIRRWSRPVRFWCLSAFAFWLLTLGPSLRINGHDSDLPLPFALVSQLPFFEGNRYPSRYSVLLVLSLAVLVAFGLAAILKGGKEHPSVARRVAPLLLVALLLFEHLSIPLPLSDMRVPPVYQAIAEMPGDWTLLDLPLAWRNGSRITGTMHPIIMFEQYYQSVHGKRILAGNTSRNPPLKFQYYTTAPLLNTLIALVTGHTVDPAAIEADQALAADVLRFFDIQTIVVHPAQAGPEVVSYVEATMPVERFYADSETIVYRVSLPPWPARWTVEPGAALGRLSYAEGWGLPTAGLIWAQRRAVRLLVPLNGQDQRLTFRAYAPAEGQELRLEANGQEAGRLELAAGWHDYQLSLPANLVQPGLNEIWLHFANLYPADQAQPSLRTVGQTGSRSPVNLGVHSAGQEVGDFGHIYVNGQDVSPNGRGYNVAVIEPQSGVVERTATFDTHLDEGASQALASFLRQVPPGWIVAVAGADEASRLLDQEAVDALHGIGAQGDLRAKFRWGHAIVGVQGAEPGSALEALDWMQPVAVVVGEGASEPHLAAALATLTFEAVPGP